MLIHSVVILYTHTRLLADHNLNAIQYRRKRYNYRSKRDTLSKQARYSIDANVVQYRCKRYTVSMQMRCSIDADAIHYRSKRYTVSMQS